MAVIGDGTLGAGNSSILTSLFSMFSGGKKGGSEANPGSGRAGSAEYPSASDLASSPMDKQSDSMFSDKMPNAEDTMSPILRRLQGYKSKSDDGQMNGGNPGGILSAIAAIL